VALPAPVEIGLGGTEAAAGDEIEVEARIADLEVGLEAIAGVLAEAPEAIFVAQKEVSLPDRL
jgi:hypothetical protein